MTLVSLKEALYIIRQSEDLHKGVVSISAEYIKSRIATSQQEALQQLDIRFRDQHSIINAEVSTSGMRYQWANSFALRGADLNGETKYLAFEPSPKMSVKAASFGAKALRWTPRLLSVGLIAPGASLAINYIGKCLIDKLAERIVDGKVKEYLDAQGFYLDGDRWTLAFNEELFNNHPAFTPVEIPWIGRGALFGDVIIVRRLMLEDDEMRVQLGINPLIAQMAQKLYPSSIASEIGALAIAGGDAVRDELIRLTEFSPRSMLPENTALSNNLALNPRQWIDKWDASQDTKAENDADETKPEAVSRETEEQSTQWFEDIPFAKTFGKEEATENLATEALGESEEPSPPNPSSPSEESSPSKNDRSKDNQPEESAAKKKSAEKDTSQKLTQGSWIGGLKGSMSNSWKATKDTQNNDGDNEAALSQNLEQTDSDSSPLSLMGSTGADIRRAVEEKKDLMTNALKTAKGAASVPSFRLGNFQKALESGDEEKLEAQYDANQPEELMDVEWAEHLETMDVAPPNALVDDFGHFELVDFALDNLL
ncbi:hypothetical protein [Salisaeta longa]|uniref:hypothetical protein n=1 Tax=Salisaeta longa TaxID=503170 RepID=UPI0003B4335B|nr:hypothetical protein [Salisaeta longa]